jgi:hypothetical protein
MVEDVAGTAAFYIRHLAFAPLFEADWYVHLQAKGDPGVNLAILQGDHETIPEAARGRASGLLLNFEVEDVDTLYDEAIAAMAPEGSYGSFELKLAAGRRVFEAIKDGTADPSTYRKFTPEG